MQLKRLLFTVVATICLSSLFAQKSADSSRRDERIYNKVIEEWGSFPDEFKRAIANSYVDQNKNQKTTITPFERAEAGKKAEESRIRNLQEIEAERLKRKKFLHNPLLVQDEETKKKISLRDKKIKDLKRTIEKFHNEQAVMKQKIDNYLLRTGEKRERILAGGKRAVMVDLSYGHPAYYSSMSTDTADSISTDELWPGGSSGFDLGGTGTTIGMWDEEGVRLTHSEYINRVTQVDSPASINFHATGVAGVLISGGVNDILSNNINIGKAAKGMSFEANLLAHTFDDDITEMGDAILNFGLELSNHSYGITSGWALDFTSNVWFWYGETLLSNDEDFKFGFYHPKTQSIDELIYDSDTYLPVFAAGNDRGGFDNGPASQPVDHFALVNNQFQFFSGVTRNTDGDSGGYDTMSTLACAKNVLTVGAVEDIIGGYTGSSSVIISVFSAFGPTDDGRIKPDVVGNGVGVITTNSSSDTAYQLRSGTSFSAPSVTGSLNLLRQLYTELHPQRPSMLASTQKAICIHTADAAGNPGPDYIFGWGLMNSISAANLIESDSLTEAKAHIKETVLINGDYIEFPIVSSGAEVLKVTLCWTDPAGTAFTSISSVDPVNPTLVNDLDLRLTSPASVVHLPYVLNPLAPGNTATTGDNFRDNVEQIEIAAPEAGTYTVRINHKNSLLNGHQNVSILISGNDPQPKPPFRVEDISTDINPDTYSILWNSFVGQKYKIQYKEEIDDTVWIDIAGEISATKVNASTIVTAGSLLDNTFFRVVEIE